MKGHEKDPPDAGRETPRHLWVVGWLALLWSAMGAFDYLATQLQWEFYMGQFTEEQLAYFYGFPAWVVAAWAVAVWGEVAGAVGLLMRRAWAVWMFAVSLAAMMVSTLYTYGMSDGVEIMGTGGAVFSAVIAAVAVFLYLYSRRQERGGVLI